MTPKPSFANPTAVPHSPLPLFFTASKNTSSSTAATPTSAFRRRHPSAVVPPSASRCVKAARRHKAFEVEQSRSSRKARMRRERALKSFARSMTAWLNFLLENPRLCGCEVSVWSGGGGSEGLSVGLSPKGKREGSRQGGGRVRVDRAWRSPKRQRGVDHVAVRSAPFLLLWESLRDVCSFEDLKQRMGGYLDERNCEEVFSMMSQVAKNIDEGRLKMKGCCPIVTDLALKKKATRVLMCYTRKWLRIGLYIVFGGESLLLKEDRTSEQDDLLLKMIIERQFFSHIGLAKSYSYNKLVEEFLSEVMHGEGDLLSHLAIVGYKVTHQQLPLAEYNFSITSLFEDLQDGLRLCRAIQLLQSDASIVSKLMAPSDNSKKSLHNCGVAMQYLKKAGVSLLDKDGVIIVAEDILNGDKELTLSILWNMFVYLQIPLLINKTLLVDEIASIKGCDMDSKYDANNYLDTLLVWIQAIGEKFGVMVDDFSSMVDGKALKCLVDYYFGDELHGCNIFEHEDENKHECAITSLTAIENTAATAPIRNFVLAQKVAKVLGSYPEILQIGDILELDETFDERSVIILLVFLVAQLVGRKDLDQINIYKLMGFKSRTPSLRCSSTSHSPHRSGISLLNIQSWTETITQNLDHLEVQKILENINAKERAARVIQCHYRGFIERRKFLKVKASTLFLQIVTRAWFIGRSKIASNKVDIVLFSHRLSFEHQVIFTRYLQFITERYSFLRIQKSVLLIQRATRRWMTQNHMQKAALLSEEKLVNAATTLQSYIRGCMARSRYNITASQIQKIGLQVILKGVAIRLLPLEQDKDDGYFISCELLKKLCMTRKGIEVVRGSQAFLKRIHAHAEDLKRKANNQRRPCRQLAFSTPTVNTVETLARSPAPKGRSW
ncbi:hypothetical protein QJS10_CPB11g01307 [Acorus calamus]|uniref:Calponin-homology (CH) domain-containing protein n=1 Tax=Acorus calamus TaxID=4465 RepID=A0AAV9DR15_ACOCL|nr:hypothetical protein QJS10_CPB11g01307 [Acorus calamus]